MSASSAPHHKKRDLIRLAVEIEPLKKRAYVSAASFELTLEPLFSLLPGVRIDRAFNVEKMFRLWMNRNDIQLAFEATLVSLANEHRLSDEVAIIFEPLGSKIFKMVGHFNSLTPRCLRPRNHLHRSIQCGK